MTVQAPAIAPSAPARRGRINSCSPSKLAATLGGGGLFTPDDRLPSDRYEARRGDVVAELIAHKRHRRLEIDDCACLVFESRFTAWFQLQEELRFRPNLTPEAIAESVARANRMVPATGELRATLLVERGDARGQRFAERATRHLPSLELVVGGHDLVASSLEESDEIEPVTFLRFTRRGPSGDRADGQAALRWLPLDWSVPLPEPLARSLGQELSLA